MTGNCAYIRFNDRQSHRQCVISDSLSSQVNILDGRKSRFPVPYIRVRCMEIRGATAWSQTIPCIGDSMPFTTWLDGFLYAGKNTNHNCEVMDKFSLLGPCNSVACMRAFGVWLNSGSVVTKLRKYVVRTYLFFGIC